MNDFDYEVMQKKRIAGQAKYRKRGSKSKKCSLSTDHMTQKQWKERCGEVMTYNLNKPMTWSEFCSLPNDIQKEYIEKLQKNFGVTSSALAKMFGVAPPTVRLHCTKPEFGIRFDRNRRMTEADKQAFFSFVEGTDKDEKTESGQNEGAKTMEDAQVVQIDEFRPSKMDMTEFTLRFSGKLDPQMVANSLAAMFPAGTDVAVDVRCSRIA